MTFPIDAMTWGTSAPSVTRTIQKADPAVDIDLDRRLVDVRSQEPSTAFAPALAQVGYRAVAAA